ncbi:DNA excision repair protein ERCC-6-like [Coccinella septempunctata]|uniref:DNA excision repair protein ERCC-6-like n=1 Tax=Coccinella septempunctata TaxID=41139 RepID=UPI001D07B22A|nr:DNA excision repair protein ERCC-6-like [Coccinella septempunctata]XP_044747305.1 DNA excision repair protein ERCC-6-like [Coccinella septempunctata]
MASELGEHIKDNEALLNSEGINVWSATQESLENQALNELREFAKETAAKQENENKDQIEDEEPKSKELIILENYIRKQEELRKLQIQKKISEKPKQVVPEDKDQNKDYVILKRKNVSGPDSKRKKKILKVEDKHAPNSKDDDSSCSEYIPSEEDSDYDYEGNLSAHISVKRSTNNKFKDLEKLKDDGLIDDYNFRLDHYYKQLEKRDEEDNASSSENTVSDKKIDGVLKVPAKYWNKLYKYQQKGVKWLWSLHQKSSGGLLGDEMGLGKTVQIISFLYALDYSRIHTPFGNFVGKGPTIIVCPATVIHQWVQHFHEWAPEFRVAVLHQSGRFQGNKAVLIRDINEDNGVLVTTYLGILKYKGNLLDHHWHYLILDEGHKIRNATAKVTVAVKQIRTPHRILLSGSPMQNNLQELWSLFDFTNPGILGALNTFMEHFNNPIIQGGFANASPMQEATALSVATALKNLISPFLLRRTKAEVQDNIELPSKSEQVLFCSLSDYQRMLYKDYLMSEHVNNILGRGTKTWSSDNYIRANMLMAITSLRKICNHPDIFIYDDDEIPEETDEENMFGYYKKSGKMIVVSALLKIWKKQKHRVLLFSQGRAMIKIFEKFLQDQNYQYLKMDGTTSIGSRQTLIDKFNKDETIDVFLLTTKVGGLGVNLTGADRVIIYDPDWNPATDTQARERAWRIGQNKQVTIYRLISAGTIEEKMYQRQIWKQLLSNKILIDPKTHRAFKSSDLFDLFSLQEPTDNSNPETTNIFHDSRVRIQEKLLEKKKSKKKDISGDEIVFSEEKIEKMKLLAQQLAKNITQEKPECSKTSYQKQLEEERLERLRKKEELKKLSVQELLVLNREKAKAKPEDTSNKVDDREIACSFSKALDIAETKAELYNKLMEGKLDVKVLEEKLNKEKLKEKEAEKSEVKLKNKNKEDKKKDKKEKVYIDESGKIDGEKVEGLVKTEKKKSKRNDTHQDSNKDDFILSKLFSSKGVSGALEHDSIIKGSVRQNNLRISSAASEKAQKAMQAITKSRLEKWRW